MSEESKSSNWFHTLPGILTATATILTAATGLIVALHQTGVLKSSQQGAGASPAQTDSSVQTPNPNSSVLETPAPSLQEPLPGEKPRKKRKD